MKEKVLDYLRGRENDLNKIKDLLKKGEDRDEELHRRADSGLN